MNADIDISAVTLKTERLTLRPFRQDDLEDLYEYASVDGVGQMAGWQPHKDRGVSQMILDDFIEGKKTFALEYEGKVIGSLGIEAYDEQQYPGLADLKTREIGYVLAKPYWGRGLTPEAVKRVIDWLFEEAGLDAVVCGHFLTNRQSARVQQKCGFHFYAYGTFQTHTDVPETVENQLNIITREEWESSGQNDSR